MSLLVVPLAPNEVDRLTLGEWDALVACERVLFERPDHPLGARLAAAGVATGALGDDRAGGAGSDAPHAHSRAPERRGVVVEPTSERTVELARAGATVTSGAAEAPDSLAAAHAAPVVRRASSSLGSLAAVMARLRSEDGCPWDREQTHASLTVHLLEEAYEVVDAIESGSPEDLREELGDVLLQVAFHSRLAEQEGNFDLAAVADGIVAKLVHRHPHVFGDVEVTGAAEVLANWEALKAAEKGGTGDSEGERTPNALPALLAAVKVQKRAARAGFAPTEEEARRRALDAAGSARLGAALFWLVAVARATRVDPEGALRASIRAFRAGEEP
jgi:XTP/dITP diphosphohydrolase